MRKVGFYFFLVVSVFLPSVLSAQSPYLVLTRGESDSKKIFAGLMSQSFLTGRSSAVRAKELNFHEFHHIRGFSANLMPEEVAVLKRSPNVELVEPDIERWLLDENPKNKTLDVDQQEVIPYGIVLVGAEKFWEISQGLGIKVAMLDSGMDIQHPDLADAYKGGVNILNPTMDPIDDVGHGTHVAGTIAARRNGIGVVGVAPLASLYPVKVCDMYSLCWTSAIMQGVEWCMDNEINVINMSFGGSYYSVAEDTLYRNAQIKGIMLVAAAGNGGDTENPSVLYPAAYDSVLAVGAVDQNIEVAYFSSFGEKLDLVAPGVNVLSTFISEKNPYVENSGTSMATPHVAGVAALIWSAEPTSSVYQIFDALMHGTTDILEPSWDPKSGYGLSNAQAALERLQSFTNNKRRAVRH